MDGDLIIDAYLSNDIDDYIDKVSRPIIHLKTITGGELKAVVCSKQLKDYIEWVADSKVRKKIERINIMFRNCPDDEETVKKLTEQL